MRRFVTAATCAAALASACAPAVRRTTDRNPTPAELAQLWIDPGGSRRHLLAGVGGGGPRPAADAEYQILERDTGGFSITYKVRDKAGRMWRVKIGPEAQTEIVSSRIVWALGYHQVPSYFVKRWIAVDQAKGSMLGGSRFRPDDETLKPAGSWSWQQNPFVGTKPYQGLLVVMMILNSTDLKNDNNALYDVVGSPRDGAHRWYVVKDLGATLGETGRMDPRRGNIDAFERERFITGVRGEHVRFGYRGRHQEIVARITPADVRWACERMAALGESQWRDAFEAGGYDPEVSARFVAKIKEKIADGLALDSTGGAAPHTGQASASAGPRPAGGASK